MHSSLRRASLLLRLELGDARGLFEDQAAVLGFAGEDLGDVALRHDAVAGPAHAGAHEELLDVLEPAGGLVDEIFAATVPEDAAGDGDFVVSPFDTGGPQMLLVHVADGQRTSAMPSGLRPSVPLKMTSAISPPRRALADCSPEPSGWRRRRWIYRSRWGRRSRSRPAGN